MSPRFARPDVMNNTRAAQITNDINTVLSRPDFNKISYGSSGALSGGPMEQLLRAVAPNCTQLIMQCSIGKAVMSGWDCCRNYFDQNPYYTESGVKEKNHDLTYHDVMYSVTRLGDLWNFGPLFKVFGNN